MTGAGGTNGYCLHCTSLTTGAPITIGILQAVTICHVHLRCPAVCCLLWQADESRRSGSGRTTASRCDAPIAPFLIADRSSCSETGTTKIYTPQNN